MNRNLGKYTVSFGLSLALCSVLNALLVVAKEKSPAVAAAMQRLTGHHWITHSAGVVLLFVLFGCLFSLLNGGRGPQLGPNRLLGFVAGGVLTGVFLILGFYLVVD
jgi:hypothetical protein